MLGAKHSLWAAISGAAFCLAACNGSVTVAAGGSAGASTGGTGTAQGGTGSGAQAGTGAHSGSGGSSTGGTTATTTSTSTGCAPAPVPVPCLQNGDTPKSVSCGDGADNDGDGLIDWQDPDCLGVCDDDEDSYYGQLPSSNGPPCVPDCWFDPDKGSGSDECYWTHKCDPLEQTPPGYPEPIAKCAYDPMVNPPGPPVTCDEVMMQQSDKCLSYCGPLTPNGCDCFGCCELPAGSGKYKWIGSVDAQGFPTCSSAGEDDPALCPPCTPVTSCLNLCETCELCIGKSALPPECLSPDGAPEQQCPDGIQKCGFGCQELCPQAMYCVTGCCQPVSTL